ncbi:MAG: ArgE/DapE family deacylase [Nocardioides sp.]
MIGLSDREAGVVAALDEQALVDHLAALVRLPSISGSGAECEIQHVVAGEYAAWGLDVDTWALDLDALRADPRFPGTEVDRAEAYGMVASTGPGTPALVLQGHVDVVPTGDLAKWEGAEPFAASVRGSGRGFLHGRGACDMKAGVAANAAVVRTLAAVGVRLERPLAVHTVVGEEDGGLGAFAALVRGHSGDVCVIPEPTSGRMITANAGALTFRIEVDGRAAHASTRLSGHSAFDAFLPVYAALGELERERNRVVDPLFAGLSLPYGLSVGIVQAGDWASSVPDRLVADGRLGVILGEDVADARASLERTVTEACAGDPWLRDHPATVTWPGGQFASGRLPDDDPLIEEVATAAEDTHGSRPVPAAGPYGSDLRLMLGIGGIPTLQYGPGEAEDAHAPRERVDLGQTIEIARSLLVLALRRCGTR